ncbi:MAG: putative ABC transporter permease [Clostridium sp.]|nr:putative ABC transporter permease [Clostridium sp.]
MDQQLPKKKSSPAVYKYLFLFLVGGFAYFYIEILFRGYSHFSMIICGGLALILCGLINQLMNFRISVLTQMIISAVIITGLEFVTGYIVNLRLHWNVWDYSGMPYNLYGQICLAYSSIWLMLSLVCIFVDDLIRWKIFDEEKARYKWF